MDKGYSFTVLLDKQRGKTLREAAETLARDLERRGYRGVIVDGLNKATDHEESIELAFGPPYKLIAEMTPQDWEAAALGINALLNEYMQHFRDGLQRMAQVLLKVSAQASASEGGVYDC